MAAKIDTPLRPELCAASDAEIEDAVQYTDPMVLRGLLYQLTEDAELVADISVKTVMAGFFEAPVPETDVDLALLHRKAAEFLKAYRDAGAGPIDIGPEERLGPSLRLMFNDPIPELDVAMLVEELALDPWARSLAWQKAPKPERLQDFSVTIIGAGLGGLNAALMLKRAGIPYTVIEKNGNVGGTWHENRYPGARVDTPSRSYTHLFAADFGYPNPFCGWEENERYFNWVADAFSLRDGIVFDTEVRSLTWDETDGMWEIRAEGPDGAFVRRSNAVITAVGFLNRPNMPEIEGMADFQGPSWHTARWPQGFDLQGKRIAVIGTGATGCQTVPELALEAEHVTVFQRTPQWLFPVPGYRSPFPPQVGWLDRNLPYHANFMRCRSLYAPWFPALSTIDPEFGDPFACSASNKRARDSCIAFMQEKLGDPKLVETMIPPHPVWSARAIIVDPEYNYYDAVRRDNVTLVTDGIRRLTPTGIEAEDGTHREVDAIVYATGFHATDYLFPMTITGRGGKTVDELWADGGARAYLGCMMPGFPNLWSIYGPNTNGALLVSPFHEMVTLYALKCMELLILDDKATIEVTEEAYWRYAELIDRENNRRVWSDPKAHNYYWTRHGRSATQNPLTAPQMWNMLREPDTADMVLD